MTRALPTALAALAALALAGACVDWAQLDAPLPDAGVDLDAGTNLDGGAIVDAGTDVDAGPACPLTALGEPQAPASVCGGSLEPLVDEHWQPHNFVATGTNEPMLGALVDALLVVDGERVEAWCGDTAVTGFPVTCHRALGGHSDVAPDGSVVVGGHGSACVIRSDLCACSELVADAAPAAVAVVTSTTFVVLVQRTGAQVNDVPLLEERLLASPDTVVGSLALPEVPRFPDVPELTRLAPPCGNDGSWAVVANFADARMLVTLERRRAGDEPVLRRIDDYLQGEVVGVVAAPVGAAPQTSTPAFVVGIDTGLAITTRTDQLSTQARTLGGTTQGDLAGYGDFLARTCATRADGAYACVGTPGLLVLGLPGRSPALVPSQAAAPRSGDTAGSSYRGDDAWIFGDDFAALTSHSAPTPPSPVDTNVSADATTGARVVGAALGDGKIFVGSPAGSAVVTAGGGTVAEVVAIDLAIDALAMAGRVAGDGVLVWVNGAGAYARAMAMNSAGAVVGAANDEPTIAAVAAAVDPEYPGPEVALWIAGFEPLSGTDARVTLQLCRAEAPGDIPDVVCDPPESIGALVRPVPWDDAVMSIVEGYLLFSSGGGVTVARLNAAHTAVDDWSTGLVLPVNNHDPLEGGTRAITRVGDCVYLASAGRVVVPIHLTYATADWLEVLAPLERQLDTRTLLTMYDDSVLVGAEHGRMGRFELGPAATSCSNNDASAPFAVSYGPVRPTGRLVRRPVFTEQALYVADVDRTIWRVPLPP